MKKIFATFGLVVTAFSIYAAGPVCQRHVETTGGYSICPPAGWKIEPASQGPYKSFIGPSSDVLTPNINVQEEVAKLSLAQYVAAGRKNTVKIAKDAGFTRVDILNQSNFVTDSKESSIRVLYSSEFKDVQMTALQYTFNGSRDRKIVVTCTMLESEKAKFVPICDRAAKSFKTESP